ncbi:MAG: sigma-70 family RNA polymerase sigma factor [Myxococcota bacterium]
MFPRCAPAPADSAPVTQLLRGWNQGERQATEALMGAVYDQLRAIAKRQLRAERSSHTLQPTAVVHEAYARLAGQSVVQWQDRRHFFAVASATMRRILVDHARARLAAKRGGGASRPSWEELEHEPECSATSLCDAELLAIDAALTRLHAFDPDKAQLVQLRFFGGHSLEETAELMGCSRGTIVRQWRMAKAWLFRELGGGEG